MKGKIKMNLILSKLEENNCDHNKFRITNQMSIIIDNKLNRLSQYVTENELNSILSTVGTEIVKYIDFKSKTNANLYIGLQICKLLHIMQRKYIIHKPFEPDIE